MFSSFLKRNKYYDSRRNQSVSDVCRFKKIDIDHTESLKKELIKLISEVSSYGDSCKLTRREGQYTPGYIYWNPKVTEGVLNPPMRPVTSQVGTVTNEISKQINALSVPYVPSRQNAKSTSNFLRLLRTCEDR